MECKHGNKSPCSLCDEEDAEHDKAMADLYSPVGWCYVPSKVWGDQVLTQEPKVAQLAREMGRDVEPLYTEAQMLARVAAERERCAKLCESIGDKYQTLESRKYPELKTDAETGARDCEQAIRSQ